MEIRIEKYNSTHREVWNSFVSSSKNGTFLFHRDFMEYHADRFVDCSLLFYSKNKLVALLPANAHDTTIYTHQGLTYGGLVLSTSATTKNVLDIFDALRSYLCDRRFATLVYKTVPHIYHRLPSEEDLYALFLNDAQLVARAVSSCILQQDRLKYSELRRRGIKKAENKGLSVRENTYFDRFWKILDDNLSAKFGVSPVHSLSEIEYLKAKFPNHIRLFEVSDSQKILAGCVVFETDTVSHLQYISASDEGKEIGALDFLFNYLIQYTYVDKPFFEFGISTEKNGSILNEGLISQKEGFGGRAIVYDTYQIQLI